MESKKSTQINYGHVAAVMPDGTAAPDIMTEEEVIRYLRLHEIGVKNPANTLRNYRGQGLLRSTQIGGRKVYYRKSIVEFVEEMTYLTDERRKR